MSSSEIVGSPGGCHEGAAVQKRVATLGSVRCPVASTPAPGAVGKRSRILQHGTPEMFIFHWFYKVLYDAPGHRILTGFIRVSENVCHKLVL